jgi:hypothetical protein
VREARSEMIALSRQKNLRFVRKPPERFCVQDFVTVTLKLIAKRICMR